MGAMDWPDALAAVATARGLPLAPAAHPEPLAHLAYPDELALKRNAFERFWSAAKLPGRPEAVVAAPRPRGYRTTSKRRALTRKGGVALVFPGLAHDARTPSLLDAPEHGPVYDWLRGRLARPPAAPLARVLTHAIVRGSARGLAVILNLAAFDGPVVRAAKRLGEELDAAGLGVRSAFLYLDPTASDYYLEARRPAGRLSWKRLFGPEHLTTEVGGVSLRYPPTAFAQVNDAMVPVMVETARVLLSPLAGHRLLDLYCGYGLFSCTAGGDAAEVVGADHDGPAIEAARGNARHVLRGVRTRFVAGRIDGTFLEERLPRSDGGAEVLLLDPPRLGTADGVAEAVAARGPERVVHVFCGTDEVPRELQAWARAGYRARRAVPLDLFPGTNGLETFVQLTR